MTAREIVRSVLDGVEFTAPVELADVVEVRRRIVEQLARPAQVEVFTRNREVVRDPAARVVQVVIEVREPGAAPVLEIREVQ